MCWDLSRSDPIRIPHGRIHCAHLLFERGGAMGPQQQGRVFKLTRLGWHPFCGMKEVAPLGPLHLQAVGSFYTQLPLALLSVSVPMQVTNPKTRI